MKRVVLLVAGGLLLGALLTGAVGALPGSQDLNALSWLGTVATVAALVVAVGIYRVQQTQSDAAHQELLDALKAQDEILNDLADAGPTGQSSPSAQSPSSAEQAESAESAETPTPPPTPELRAPGRGWAPVADVLSAAQREAVEARFADRSIEAAWQADGRGDRNGRGRRPTLVRLDDGTLVSVFEDPRGRGVRVHEVRSRHDRGRPSRDRRPRGPQTPGD